MKRKLFSMALTALLVGAPAFAQEEMTTERRAEEVSEGVFQSPLNVSPRVGILGFSDSADEYTTRAMGGFSLEWLPTENLTGIDKLNLGIETGFLYSHIGSQDAGLFGSSDSGEALAGANSFVVPGNLVIGYELSDSFRVAGLLGTNMIYRSDAASMDLGRGTGDDSVEFFPSAGLNLGWGIGKSVALSLRGEYVPTPAEDMFNSSLGVTVPLA